MNVSTQTPPRHRVARSANDDSWMIVVSHNGQTGILELWDDGDIVALLSRGKEIKTVSFEDE